MHFNMKIAKIQNIMLYINLITKITFFLTNKYVYTWIVLFSKHLQICNFEKYKSTNFSSSINFQ